MSAEVFAALLVWSLTLPWALMMARYKVPSSGTPCPLSQMAPKTKTPQEQTQLLLIPGLRAEEAGWGRGAHTSC